MLMREINEKAALYAKEYVVKTIFIGGGTPTSVDVNLLCQVLENVKTQFEVCTDAEISMECNPGTANKAALKNIGRQGSIV